MMHFSVISEQFCVLKINTKNYHSRQSLDQFEHAKINAAGSLRNLLFHQELISEMISGEDEKSCTQRLCLFAVHLMAWVTCLVIIFFSTMAVHWLSEVRNQLLCSQS